MTTSTKTLTTLVGAALAIEKLRVASEIRQTHLTRQEKRDPEIESFFDKLRDECLNREVFRNGREAQAIVENWRQEYNNYRPHS